MSPTPLLGLSVRAATIPVVVLSRSEWFADESIWKDLYPFQFPEPAFAVAGEQVEKIVCLLASSGAAFSISVVAPDGMRSRSPSAASP